MSTADEYCRRFLTITGSNVPSRSRGISTSTSPDESVSNVLDWRLSDVDEIVLSLDAKGLTTGEINAHFEQIHGANVSRDTVSRITDPVIEEMQAWSARPLETVCAAIFIDAIKVKMRVSVVKSIGPTVALFAGTRLTTLMRDGQVGNRLV